MVVALREIVGAVEVEPHSQLSQWLGEVEEEVVVVVVTVGARVEPAEAFHSHRQ